jgi:hypothetical protein
MNGVSGHEGQPFCEKIGFFGYVDCLLPSESPAKVREEQVVDFVLEKLIALTYDLVDACAFSLHQPETLKL